MQVIFSLIHKQDSISLPMNKQSVAEVYSATTQKNSLLRRLLPPYYNIVTPSPNQNEPMYGI